MNQVHTPNYWYKRVVSANAKISWYTKDTWKLAFMIPVLTELALKRFSTNAEQGW